MEVGTNATKVATWRGIVNSGNRASAAQYSRSLQDDFEEEVNAAIDTDRLLGRRRLNTDDAMSTLQAAMGQGWEAALQERLAGFPAAELAKILKHLGIPQQGTKPELEARVFEALAAEREAAGEQRR